MRGKIRPVHRIASKETGMDGALETAAKVMAAAQQVTCLTGAGISAESGVATFRDAQTGHWSKFNPEQLASQVGFARDPSLVWRWYMARLRTLGKVHPNPGHLALAALAAHIPRFALITQNVDDLHERAGSAPVLHLHGTLLDYRCNRCHAPYALTVADARADEPPRCPHCGGPVRPGVVWFGESLPTHVVDQAWTAARNCDVMLVVGTSGIVYPAAGLPTLAARRGAVIIAVNPEPTPITATATHYLQGTAGTVLPQLQAAVAAWRSQ
jgi:NAD-dependent deacetylase